MSVASILGNADIFDELTSTQLELVSSICDERHYQAGDVIFEENTVGNEMYVISTGEVEIQVDPALIGNEAVAMRAKTRNTHGKNIVDERKRRACA